MQTQLPLEFFSVDAVVNVASVPQLSPFRYPGGKTWLVPQIRRWLQAIGRPQLFIEPFAGGGIVGLTVAEEDLSRAVLLVEKDAAVAAVWKIILSRHADKLAQMVMSFELEADNVQRCLSARPRRLLDTAFATILRNRVQHGGILAPGASVMKEGENGKGIGSRWYPATLARRIRRIAENRHKLGFVQGDAFGAIEQYANAENVAFFVDPPYTVAGRRLYRHSEVDHRRLFSAMSKVSGSFLMTYDNTQEVRAWASEAGLEVRPIAMKSRQHRPKSELLISRNLDWAR